MDRDFDDYTITSLTTAIEQIKKKGNKITEMDERISTLIDDAMELESHMYDAEQFQDDIIDQIAKANRYVQLSLIADHRHLHVLIHSWIPNNHCWKVLTPV